MFPSCQKHRGENNNILSLSGIDPPFGVKYLMPCSLRPVSLSFDQYLSQLGSNELLALWKTKF
jgi:hypothetical protein